jgi:putative transposase
MELDVFQIMPNHMHGIIMLKDIIEANFDETNVGAPLAGARNIQDATNNIDQPSGTNRAGASPAPTLFKPVGDIVGAYKSLVANNCLEIYKQKHPGKIMGKLWQRNYHEHIIRDEQSYQKISEYIITNPQSWEDDKFYINFDETT